MKKILLIQGANMAYLGKREPEIYGTTTAAELDLMLQRHARERGFELDIYYTHIEGEAIGRVYRAAEEGVDGLLMNPAGFIHAGYALRDCLRAMRFPYVEVHMSNIDKRGLHSVTAETARGLIAGFGLNSYFMGLDALLALTAHETPANG
ncbi:MAG: type II 3-dehydroquinate dehydratase [Burkholderiales bacterium]|jgi:3-dehydroquinate dehydratase-2